MRLTLQVDDPPAVQRLRGRDGSGLVCPLEAAKTVAIILPLHDVFATCPDLLDLLHLVEQNLGRA